MKRKLLILLFIIFSFLLFAQAPEWQWAAQAGGSDRECGNSIAIDDNGNSYVTGWFNETATFGSYSLTSSGDADIFLAKMDADGNWLWAAQADGSEGEIGNSIATDDNGESYVTGFFWGTATFGSYTLTSSGHSDLFVAKMDANGNWLWASQAGGSSSDNSRAIAIDENGNSYVTGKFHGTATFGSYSLTGSGNYSDIFVAKLDSIGNWLWATKAGGSGIDEGYAIAIDENGNNYVTGYFRDDTAFFGSDSLTCSGAKDIFVAKLGNDTSVENEIIPIKMELSNYPNPFNPSTIIEFSIQYNSNIELSIYNIKGKKIKTLTDNDFTKGSHSIIWNGDNEFGDSVSSGVYLYKLNVNSKTEAVKKCLLLK